MKNKDFSYICSYFFHDDYINGTRSLTISPMQKLLFLILISSWHCIASVPLNSTIMIFHHKDLRLCTQRVDNALELGNTRLHFVPTIYAKTKKPNQVIGYMFGNKHAKYESFNSDYLEYYQNTLIDCLRYTLDKGVDVYLTPHLDNVAKVGGSRNVLDYDPIKNYEGFSFSKIMFSYLRHLDEDQQKRVYLSLIGEMGRSLKLYPKSYEFLVQNLPTRVKKGLSFNFNKMLGSFKLEKFEKISGFKEEISFINQLDFLGVSAYYSVKSHCSASDFEKNAQLFYKQMRDRGMRRALRLHFTEISIGGGYESAELSARRPYAGVHGAYFVESDPWQKPELAALRLRYHKCLLGFLEKTPTIQAAFLWNSNSWDVQGLYPFSKDYRDEDISELIRLHNKKSDY